VHEPVLLGEVVRLLEPKPGQTILDGTVGLGGHAAAILPRIAPHGRYLGLDLDPQMLEQAAARLAPPPDVTLELIEANFADLPVLLSQRGIEAVDAMLLDLGVNSAQLADPQRGFSFEHEGPLDMRFSPQQREQAVELVNRLSERELADLFYHLGGETQSRKIARAICAARRSGRIRTTRALARIVESAVGGRRGRIHPATRVFQALRIAVNRELENLDRFLDACFTHLRPGGRVAVISFHSLEDGRVKRAFREAARAGVARVLTPRPVTPDADEIRRNPRSRSAKLRVAERLKSEERSQKSETGPP